MAAPDLKSSLLALKKLSVSSLPIVKVSTVSCDGSPSLRRNVSAFRRARKGREKNLAVYLGYTAAYRHYSSLQSTFLPECRIPLYFLQRLIGLHSEDALGLSMIGLTRKLQTLQWVSSAPDEMPVETSRRALPNDSLCHPR